MILMMTSLRAVEIYEKASGKATININFMIIGLVIAISSKIMYN